MRAVTLCLSLAVLGLPGILEAVDRAGKEISRTVDLSAGGRVSVDTYKGSIRVSGWDKGQVEIRARIEPDSGWFGTHEAEVEETEVRIDSSPDSVRIKSDYGRPRPALFSWRVLPLVHYEIRMPRAARLDIKDYKSKTEVTGLQTEARIETYKGSVAVEGLKGGLQLETYKGSARVRFDGLESRSRFETYKGEIEVTLPDNQGFELETDLGRRAGLVSDFDLKTRERRHRRGARHFSEAVNGGGPKLLLKSHRGDFRLKKGSA